jgi:hypothetical protein
LASTENSTHRRDGRERVVRNYERPLQPSRRVELGLGQRAEDDPCDGLGVASPQLAGEIFYGHRELDFFRSPQARSHQCGRTLDPFFLLTSDRTGRQFRCLGR